MARHPRPKDSPSTADPKNKSSKPGAAAGSPTKPGSSRARPAVRSTSIANVPFYKKTEDEDIDGPPVDDVLELLGLRPTRPLTADEIQPLLKADEDTLVLIGDNIVELFKRDAAALGIQHLTPEVLESLFDRVLYLVPRASTAAMAATIALHQKAVAVSDFLDALLRVRRRVNAVAEDDPDLAARWERAMGYFVTRYPGRRGGAGLASEETVAVEASAPVLAFDASATETSTPASAPSASSMPAVTATATPSKKKSTKSAK